MSEYIKLYFTANDEQIQPVDNGVGEPVSYALRADLGEVGSWTSLYALAVSGFACSGIDIALAGTTYLKWQLNIDTGGGSSPSDNPEDYGDPLPLGEVGNINKVYFHVRAKATEDETPKTDETVSLSATGIAIPE